MPRFPDKLGQTWDLLIDVDAVEQVRSKLNLDLMKIDKPEGKAIFEDQVTFVHVLYVLCEEQAEKRQINERAFAKGFNGDTFDAAVDALIEAIADFFPKHRRMILQKSAEKTRELQDQASVKVAQALESLDLDKLAKLIQSDQRTTSPES